VFDRELLTEEIGEEQLIERIRTPSIKAPIRAEALKELTRRRSPRVPEVLRAVVTDRTAPAEIRSIAAVVLGKDANPDNQRALASALFEDNVEVVRRAAESLGRIGDREALEWLEKVQPRPSEPAAKTLQLARSLISYRLSLGSHRLRAPAEKPLPVHPERRLELQVNTARQELLRRIESKLPREVPSVPLDLKSALEISCAGNEFLLIFHQDAGRAASADMLSAVVLKRYSNGEYSLHEYVLTHPDAAGSLQILGVRPTGSITHVGQAKIAERGASFRIEALNTTHSPAIEIEGTADLAQKRLTFARALVNVDLLPGQKRPRSPHPG
jgi:hypothetical protein